LEINSKFFYAKYLFLKSKNDNNDNNVPLNEIIKVESNSSILQQFNINLINGIKKNSSTTNLDNLTNMILLNDTLKIDSNSNFDGYLYCSDVKSNSQVILPFQINLSLKPPFNKTKDIIKQLILLNNSINNNDNNDNANSNKNNDNDIRLNENSVLLWFSLYNQDEKLIFTNKMVKNAYLNGKIVFLDGSGLVSQNTLSQIKYLKKSNDKKEKMNLE
jgi:hypothetical protein